MNWALLAGSLAGVLALVAVAWLLGLGGGRIASEDEAKRIAEEAVIGFHAELVLVSRDGRAALVAGAEGELVLLKQHGVHVAARRLVRPVAVEPTAEGAVLRTGERMFGDVRLDLDRENRDKLLTLV